MKKHVILVVISALLFGCKTEPSAPSANAIVPEIADTVPVRKPQKSPVVPTSHNCTVKGKLMEDNELWIPKEQLWACIVADKITHDQDFGDSYRIFDIYDTQNCRQISRKVLPVNNSPDFPWYIFQNTYEEKNQVICTSGFEFTFCYDVENRVLLPRMKPGFLLPRTALDAQSGMTQSMSVYERYLFGYAQDLGFFAYDLTNKEKIEKFLPIAEYHLKKDNQFYGLFLIPADNQKYQAVIPSINMNDGAITISPLLASPRTIDPVVAKNVRNNRFQIFTDLASPDKMKIAFDLQKGKLVKLPADIARLPVGKILDYLKKQGR